MSAAPDVSLVQTALNAAQDTSPLASIRPVPGGCINNAQRVATGKGVYLFKYNPQSLPRMFSTEAQGLELLQRTRTIKIPEVFAYAESLDGQPGWMLQEWIESGNSGQHDHAERLGASLAALHKAGEGERFGLDHDNYIGFTPQENRFDEDWVRFYRDRRLRPQILLAARNGWLTTNRRVRLERLADRIEDWLGGVKRQPALLHGDLWQGNVLYDEHGLPALIDPAVYYGDREAELAYGEWFASFPPAFYAAYEEVWPTEPNRADRRDLYNLYHALNHVNHFGEKYLAEVDRIVERYIG